MSRKEKRKHHHSQANKDHPARIQGNLPSQAPAIKADAPHGETAHEGGQNDKEPTEMPRRPDWMTIFTGILALFAFLSFIAVGIQLSDARKALEVDQRPWVTIGPDWPKEQTAQGVVGQKVVLTENARIQVPIKIENSGKTPALQLSYTANIEIVEREKSPQLENPINPIRIVGGTLFPHAPVTDFAYRWNPQKPGMPVFNVLTPVEKQALDNGDSYFAVYGDVTYRDGFGIQHWTHFCAPVVFSQKTGLFNYKCCTEYNTADANN